MRTRESRESILVVGAGMAGLRAAEALREGGFDGRLTLLGEEPHRPYNRPPLSKQVLAGTAASQPFPAEDLEVDWRLGTSAVGLDPAARRVALADGTALGYDGLVIATGCRAAPWPGPVPAAGVHTLRELADVQALEREIGPEAKVVIAGAGFLGSEAAFSLRTRGVETVHLVGRSALPLPALGTAVGERIAAGHREHGVHLHLGTAVTAISGLDRVQQVHLADGTTLEADVVLVALGAVPNTGWLVASGAMFHRGRVLCGADCRVLGAEGTGPDGARLDGIVAAGDVAAWQDVATGMPRVLEHWSHAAEMARAAAATLLAGPGPGPVYDPVPTSWSDQGELRVRAAGWIQDATSMTVLEEDPSRGRLVVEARRDGALLGAVTLNAASVHREYQRRLAAERLTQVSSAGPAARAHDVGAQATPARSSSAPGTAPTGASASSASALPPVPSIGGDHATASGHRPL